MAINISSASGKPVKAYIWNEDKNQKVVDCLFNPTEYSFTKQNTWQRNDVVGRDLPVVNFQGGGAMTLTVTLLFDTYTQPAGADGMPRDVREYTEKVLDLMKIDPTLKDANSQTGRPPRVSFRWGNTWSFKSVITSITQRFTLFLPDGRPVRATLEVTFQQVEQEGTYPRQNPTSYAEVQKFRLVGPGETIDTIAFQEYGDPTQWRRIADYNRLDNPLRLRAGQKLAIPPLA
ncbi:MAG: LysM peptidoglycan-binding domain-containing protein [Chloroflexi bacterium]|nr:LysM peptidoglycan-binding domain-containing protein [Chloroflexota bacterium]